MGEVCDNSQYDYINYLGNVHKVLTEEAKPAAVYNVTMETANRTIEEQLFTQIPETEETPKPAGFDSDGNNPIVRQQSLIVLLITITTAPVLCCEI